MRTILAVVCPMVGSLIVAAARITFALSPLQGIGTGTLVRKPLLTADIAPLSGDTVWFDGIAEVARRFPIRRAVLFMGAARVAAVGPFPLTMTAEDGIQAARAFSPATIVPIHYEDWTHFSESRKTISEAFDAAGITARVCWMQRGVATVIP